MSVLPSDLRNKLERVVIEARDAAEIGARAALESLAVNHYEPYPHMKPAQRKLRNHLRARARQLGDRKLPRAEAGGKDHKINHLVGECAYEHWHQMLFARFLAENNLLIEPESKMAISLTEAEELAAEAGVDVWVYASRCAQRMLPQIFRPDDPLLQVTFATEHMLKLEKLLASLPAVVFTASDALGWVYQFWQSKKKDEVNRSEVKIGANEIAAVTQLFTEPYMVEFLIHNTLGAWWAGKKLDAKDAANAKTEDELRAKLALPGVTWDYLRFVRGDDGKGGPWRPAAGTFDGWPKIAKSIKGLDPCCGSGHFLVAFLRHLVPIRMTEEGLSARKAVDAVLRDNIHGLEIDERCCQIAAFALALAAWTYPAAGGYRPLPELHIACTGIGPQATEEQWVKLAEKSGMPTQTDEQERVKNGLLNLHRLFSQAPTLGSLIDLKQLKANVFAAGYETIQPYLAAVLKTEKADDETREQAIAVAGMVKAAELLAGEYTLVITNVPYLGRAKQDETLKVHLAEHFPEGKADLATAFVQRCLQFCTKNGSIGLVTPQNWLFLSGYKRLRERLLRRDSLELVARLGESGFASSAAAGAFTALFVARLGAGAFDTISGEIVKAACVSISNAPIPSSTAAMCFSGIDVSDATSPADKATGLAHANISCVSIDSQLLSPDFRISFYEQQGGPSLQSVADCYQGVVTGDIERFTRTYWEVPKNASVWVPFRRSNNSAKSYGDVSEVLMWEGGHGRLHEYAAQTRDQLHDMHESGNLAWGKTGVAINRMRDLHAVPYYGEHFDNNVAVLFPKSESCSFGSLLTFCQSDQFASLVRSLDQSLKVTNRTLLKIPFDPAEWRVSSCRDGEGVFPEPYTEDPSQWVFHGWPEGSDAPLQVAVARLLGYRWPAELDGKMRLSERSRMLVKRCEGLAKFADNDGIVCIPAVRGESPAAERLESLLSAAGIKSDKMRELAGGTDLDDWLRNGFFEKHCKLFHDRPFVWHIWDGRKRDGFHALINYHKLCEGGGKGRRLLESLTYAYLGEWITRQTDGVKRGEEGAEDRLAAALELQKRLEAILAGEPPFDIFVRWKPLHEQSIGWEPDINDGVRLNIRPFLASDLPGGRSGAGILRYKPNIKWTKDRGKEPMRPKAEYPWFWTWDEKAEDFAGGKTFDGNRWNDCHYTNKVKQTARQETKK